LVISSWKGIKKRRSVAWSRSNGTFFSFGSLLIVLKKLLQMCLDGESGEKAVNVRVRLDLGRVEVKLLTPY
jgi:hypothetical protein